MAQIVEMNDGSKKIETFEKLMKMNGFGVQAIEEQESEEDFKERMLLIAQEKLRDPEVLKFYQLRVGRNEPCPCDSGLKFKKCCLNNANKGEFKIKVDVE